MLHDACLLRSADVSEGQLNPAASTCASCSTKGNDSRTLSCGHRGHPDRPFAAMALYEAFVSHSWKLGFLQVIMANVVVGKSVCAVVCGPSPTTVCVGFPRCHIWDSLPRLLRLGKWWAWPALTVFQGWVAWPCMAQTLRRQVRMGHRLTSSWVCPRLAILKFLSERKASGNPAR